VARSRPVRRIGSRDVTATVQTKPKEGDCLLDPVIRGKGAMIQYKELKKPEINPGRKQKKCWYKVQKKVTQKKMFKVHGTSGDSRLRN